MRILFVIRPNAPVRAGGDVTQALLTKRGLEAAGVEVDVVATLEPDARGYDIAHVFGIFDPEDAARQIGACQRAGVPIALSPIWWDLYEYLGRSRACERILAGPTHRIAAKLARLRETKTEDLFTRRETYKYKERIALQESLMRRAAVLLPNSMIEAHYYMHQLRLHDRPTVVIHNAAGDVPARNGIAGKRHGAVCVARIERKKNQAMLLHALRDVDIDLTFIGACYEPDYMKLCERLATPRVRWLGEAPHDEVLRIVAQAAVHILPSWAETPGIASLEAAAVGARIIVSNNGTEYEYFGEHADYVDPEDPTGIRAAVERAVSAPEREPDDALDRRLRSFSVDAVGKRTLDGYRLAL